jgi:2-oxoglutarate dehydrogenase E2 component (dihydrolipoamide succinyltransferase)
MAEIEVLLPKMGESVAEATIIKWLKSEGETIESEESLVEIATDKVDSEVPSPETGIISKILVKDGDVAKVGQAIAVISTGGNSTPPQTTPANEPKAAPTKVAAEVPYQPATTSTVSTDYSNSDKFLSPLVKSIAKEEGISVEELNNIQGSGQNGRVTKKDVLAYIPNKGKSASSTPAPTTQTTVQATPVIEVKSEPQTSVAPAKSYGDNVEIIEMDRMRKLISEHMVHSKHTSPHVTSFIEADVTNIVKWRDKVKDNFFKKEGEKLTFTPIFIEAIARAIKEFPMINISVEGSTIIRKKDINIGMAAALPSGNLIVPVIKNADLFNLTGLTKKVNDLANRARLNKLQPDEIQGGTYTLTNVGTFGNVMGTPIINQPQVAVMAAGAIRKKPAVIETPAGDFIGIRHMMFLSHSYDHRVVDGSLGGSFLKKVADYLEQFDVNREI